jgi:hypothetical protein
MSGSAVVVPVLSNGMPVFGQYRPSAGGAGHVPWALIVLELSAGRIAAVDNFLDTERHKLIGPRHHPFTPATTSMG